MLRRQFTAVLIAFTCGSTLQAGDSKLLTQKIAKLDKSKASFETVYAEQTLKLRTRFDELIAIVNNSPNLSTVRAEIANDLAKARDEFIEDGMFAKIPALQPHYMEFVLSIFSGYTILMQDYREVLASLDKGDQRLGQYTNEVTATSERVAKFDSMKKGAVFVGYREDFNWGPVKGLVESEDAIRLKVIKNGPVEALIKIEVTERNGNYIAAKLIQGKGQLIAAVNGTYDGVNLRLKFTDILKGKQRNFEYAGQVVGHMGQLQMGGVKANGVPTTGMITLQRTKEARQAKGKGKGKNKN